MAFNWRWPLLWVACLAAIAIVSQALGLTSSQQDLVDAAAALALIVLAVKFSPVVRHNLHKDHQWVGNSPQCEECHPLAVPSNSDF